MRGYRFLWKTGQLERIAAVKDALTNAHLGPASRASAVIFGAGLDNAELAVRQYLLFRLGVRVGLNKALLRSLGERTSPVVFYLPLEWRRVLRESGFGVAGFRSSMAWTAFAVLHLGYGVVSVAKAVAQSIRAMASRSRPELGRYAFFEGLNAGNLPQLGSDGRSHDIVTWYWNWPGRVGQLDILCHSVEGVAQHTRGGMPASFVSGPIPPLATPAALLRYVVWGCRAATLATVDLLRGRWWHALMLSEASRAAVVRLQTADRLAREYLFHNSAPHYRPLWTYEAERRGSQITFYFYSTNCEGIKRPEGYPLQANSWQVMNWPRYLVWDEYQAAFVRRAVGEDATISIVGPIWFQTSARDLPRIPRDCVAVFDVQPHRASRYQTLGAPDEYYTPRTANQFLLDIHRVVTECGAVMALKRKRQLGRLLNKSYGAVVQKLGRADNCILIDPEISALRVIERCTAVISMPFTSTALLGRELGKPSVYYDPHGTVQKDDRAAHGIPVVSGPNELRDWITANVGLDAAGSWRAQEGAHLSATSNVGGRG
jgi:polysaccharide biosynthesis PFTS motif protein